MRNRNLATGLRHAARRYISFPQILVLGLLCCAACIAGGCAGASASLPDAAALARALPPLPQDGMAVTRRVSTESSLTGYPTYRDSGEPNASQHPTLPDVLTLDSSGLSEPARQFTWAIWRLQLSAGVTVDGIKITTYQSPNKPFYAGLANYAAGLWQFELVQTNGASLHLPPEIELHSPGESIYVAIVVMAPYKVNVQALDITTSGGAGNDPIFDDFEPNDPMESAWPLGAGYYHASIHETFIPEMGGKDKMDFYTVSVPPGQHLTATLDYEPYDHLWTYSSDWPFPNYNDLDVLIYPPGSTLPYDQFYEPPVSGMTIYYYAADQGYLPDAGGGEYIIGILGDVDPYFKIDNNAEYDLGIYVSASVHTVSGTLTQDGAGIDYPFLVYLEYTAPVDGDRGFFNAVAPIDTEPHGRFVIPGVPDGAYTMHVRTSAAFYPYPVHPYVWPQTVAVTVAGADVTADINIEGEPPPA